MISYAPLFETLKKNGTSLDKIYRRAVIGGGTRQNIKKGKALLTTTIDILCEYLNCTVSEVIEYIPEE